MTEAQEETPNAANPKSVRGAAQKQQLLEERQKKDLLAVLEMPEGRRFLRRLVLDICKLHESSFNANGQVFAANEGRRGVGVELQVEILEVSLEAWVAILRGEEVKPSM